MNDPLSALRNLCISLDARAKIARREAELLIAQATAIETAHIEASLALDKAADALAESGTQLPESGTQLPKQVSA